LVAIHGDQVRKNAHPRNISPNKISTDHAVFNSEKTLTGEVCGRHPQRRVKSDGQDEPTRCRRKRGMSHGWRIRVVRRTEG
jgi:hypothetical protein